jgi:hypothetical protein
MAEAPGTVGAPADGADVRIVDADGMEVAAGEVGVIRIVMHPLPATVPDTRVGRIDPCCGPNTGSPVTRQCPKTGRNFVDTAISPGHAKRR